MEEIIPRFEFRAFAQSLGPVEDRVRESATYAEVSESLETYLVSPADTGSNVKVRNNVLEVKELIDQTEQLERWRPVEKLPFPVDAASVQSMVFPALQVDEIELPVVRYKPVELLANVIRPHPRLFSAFVFKRRSRFVVSGCPVELDELLVNGASIGSVAVEAEEDEAVLDVVKRIGLADYENVNYPRAIRRILGLEAYPEGCWFAA